MMKNSIFYAAVRRLVVAAATSVAGLAWGAAPTFFVAQPSTSVTAGSDFSLQIQAAGLVDAYAYQFALDFDPAVLHVTGLTEGPTLSKAGTTVFAPGAFNNTEGKLELSGASLIGDLPGYTGRAVLATVSFAAEHPGLSPVTLTDTLVLDSALNAITPTNENATVLVHPAPVPEPHMLWLLGAGGLALAWTTRKRKNS